MLAFLILGLVNLAFASNELFVIVNNGQPEDFVSDYLTLVDNGHSHLYYTGPANCIRELEVTATEVADNTKVFVERISGIVDDEYQWTRIGSGVFKNGIANAVFEEICVSSYKVTIEAETAVFKDLVATGYAKPKEKRQAANADFCGGPGTYPDDCATSDFGTKCLASEVCGCEIDTDCYNNNDYPKCIDGECTYCHGGSPDPINNYNDISDHTFCQSRFPGVRVDLDGENVAPSNFWREYCNRRDATVGACQGCQAMNHYLLGTDQESLSYQNQWAGFGKLVQTGLSGSVFCGNKNAKTPICNQKDFFEQVNPTETFDVATRGKCRGCLNSNECSMIDAAKPICGTDQSCNRCNTDFGGAGTHPCPAGNPTCNNGVCETVIICNDNNDCAAGENCMDDQRCRPCNSHSDCHNNDGGAVTKQPVCSNGVCVNCQRNNDCSTANGGANCQANGKCLNCGNAVNSANCGAPDGGEVAGQTVCNTNSQICETACTDNQFCATKGGEDAFTRGANCQKDGTCKSCTSDATCGALDGGEQQNQPQCNTATKMCETPFVCQNNNDCGPARGGANCQKSGSCVDCAVGYDSSNCDNLDGGEQQNQKNCDQATRRCVANCNNNNQCIGTQGNNCMANGLCLTCRNDADCGTGNSWGGDMGGERKCNTNTGLCEAPCSRNSDCPAGTNCNKDGSCTACTSNAHCLEVDGGEVHNQPRCSNGRCEGCLRNADCPANAPNCGADGSCYNCVAGAGQNTDANCGARDGGEIPGQVNCDTILGICVNYCTSDDDCHDDCSPVCNLNTGCCVECNRDADCPHANWKLEDAERTDCSVDHTCIKPTECNEDADCHSPERPACSIAQRKCVACIFDDHCGGDTPKCLSSSQTCVQCLANSHCGEDGECYDDNTCSGANALTVSVFVALFAGLMRLM